MDTALEAQGNMPRTCLLARPLIVVLALHVTACADAPDASPSPTPEAIANGLLPAIVLEGEAPETFAIEDRMARYRVPGVSVAVLEDGEVVWARGWGVADTETGAPVTATTLFQAASISKPVAALAALSLAQEGTLSLDAPVNDYLRTWRLPDNTFTADSAVTLRGLLTHSAGTTVWGFPGYRKDRPFSAEAVLATNAQVLEGEGNTAEVRVYKVPGTSWQYSGGGYTIIEQVIEDVTGKSFDAVLRERVLDPAGMRLSTFRQPLPEERWAEAARGHRGDGNEVEGEWHTYPEQAAAGLWTTPTELLVLSAHLLGIRDGTVTDGVLSRAMLDAMLTPNHPGEEAYRGWGLGFGLSGEGAAFTFGHGGANEGFRAQWTVYPDRRQGVAVMTNGDAGSALAAEIVRSVSAAYDWPSPKQDVRAWKRLEPEALAAYPGSYEAENGDLVVTVEAGAGVLEVDVPGQAVFTVYADADVADRFFDANDGRTLDFRRNDAGEVARLTTGGGTLVRRSR